MNKLISLLFLTLCHSNFFGQNLYIFLNPNDCISCTAPLSLIEKINSNTKINIVSKSDDGRFISDYMKELNLDANRYKLIVGDSLYNHFSVAAPESYCVYENYGEQIFSFYLKLLPNFIDKINSFYSMGEEQPLFYFDSLNLSNNLSVYSYLDELIIVDYVFQRIILKESENKFKVIEGKDVDIREIVAKSNLSIDSYTSLYPIMKQYNVHKLRFGKIYVNNEKIYTLATYMYPYKYKNDTIIEPNYALLGFNSEGGLVSINPISSSIKLKKGYSINNVNSFLVAGNSAYLSVYRKKIKKNNKFLSMWHLDNKDSLFFFEYVKVKIPPHLRQKHMRDLDFFDTNNNLIFFNHTPFLVDVSSGKSWDIRQALSRVEGDDILDIEDKSFYLIDAVKKNDLVHLIYLHKNVCKISTYDTLLDKVVSSRPLQKQKEDDINLGSIRFYSSGGIIYMNKNNQTLFKL